MNYLVLCRTEIQSSFIMGLGEDWGLIFRHNYLNPSDVLQALNSFIFKLSAFFQIPVNLWVFNQDIAL